MTQAGYSQAVSGDEILARIGKVVVFLGALVAAGGLFWGMGEVISDIEESTWSMVTFWVLLGLGGCFAVGVGISALVALARNSFGQNLWLTLGSAWVAANTGWGWVVFKHDADGFEASHLMAASTVFLLVGSVILALAVLMAIRALGPSRQPRQASIPGGVLACLGLIVLMVAFAVSLGQDESYFVYLLTSKVQLILGLALGALALAMVVAAMAVRRSAFDLVAALLASWVPAFSGAALLVALWILALYADEGESLGQDWVCIPVVVGTLILILGNLLTGLGIKRNHELDRYASSGQYGGAVQQEPVKQAAPSYPAGWYPDPSGSGRQRYWDGAQWTDHLA